MKNAVYLQAECGVRYWEDGDVDGQRDDDPDGIRMPCRDGHTWRPTIVLASGQIECWPQGTTAAIHYKVCDAGRYAVLDADRKVVSSIDGYVPAIMCPGGNGYGDYVIMTIGPDGKIANWDADLSDFGGEP